MKTLLLFLFSVCFLNFGFTCDKQLTINTTPENCKDAFINQLSAGTNFGSHPDFISYYWTFSGNPGLGKSLMQFDLSQIPANAKITSAKLALYHNSTSAAAGHTTKNSCFLKRITQTWGENSVTWNNAPATTDIKSILLHASKTTTQNYTSIMITDFVKYWYGNPTQNFGFLMELVDPVLLESMKFASSDETVVNKRPALIIEYSLEEGQLFSVQPGPEGQDAFLNDLKPNENFGTNVDFISYYWTFSGVPGKGKSLMKFDLKSIPENAVVKSATLSLYYNYVSGTAGQSTNNSFVFRRISTPWNEDLVNWTTSPSTIENGKLVLPATLSGTDDYECIDISNFVKEWINKPENNHGFMMELNNFQTLLESAKFCSSDFISYERRPKLDIIYTIPSSIDDKLSFELVKLNPNPTSDLINIIGLDDTNYRYEIINFQGQILTKNSYINSINVSNLLPGNYFLNLFDNQGKRITKKFAKI